ncbi:hypothetical protein V535_00188 [Staphylococcus aureus F19955]|nr:hypothetical protein V535_00188 [Staphylococcus aureus F19955]
MLSIKHLTKIYSGNKKAVDDISLDIQSGEFIAFIGTSGSGKTTALRMINRMIEYLKRCHLLPFYYQNKFSLNA